MCALWLASIGVASAAEKTWGVYQILWRPDQFEQGLREQIQQLGSTPDHVLFFRDLDARRGFPTEAAEICRQIGATPVISQELLRWRERGKNWLQAIGQGELDEFWKEWARAAVRFGDPVVLRFGFEMNGDWFPWGRQPEAFKKAWRRVFGIVRGEVGAGNVRFMFSPNVVWPDAPPQADFAAYYPGDEFVDLLGLDGYNFGDHYDEYHHWQSYAEVYEKSIGMMTRWKKPIYLAEAGCAADARKAGWLAEFFRQVREDERLAGFIYYNHSDGKRGEPDWRLDSDPESLKVAQRELKLMKSKQ